MLSLIALISCTDSQNKSETVEENQLILAVGSCNHTEAPQVMWDPIANNKPDVFIWLGDIVYGDTHDMGVLQSKYDKLDSELGYQKVKTITKDIIGVWDDHDYGWNDAGKYYSKKDSSKAILVDFLDLDKSDPVRDRKGMYTSYQYGNHPYLTKVILLDARYFRDTVIASPDPNIRYTINPDGDILGEEQWTWLENQLKSSDADVHIIGSGIQILPRQHGWEKWANFPQSRERLLNLLSTIRPKNPLLLTGDRHIAEYSTLSLDDGYLLPELTTSGLTHTWSQVWDEPNEFREGELIAKKNFAIVKISASQMQLEVRGELDSLFKSITIPLK